MHLRTLFATLIAEVEEKMNRPLEAKYRSKCGLCGESVEEGEDLFFFGRNRLCINCMEDILHELNILLGKY